jgi:hypothetical protein
MAQLYGPLNYFGARRTGTKGPKRCVCPQLFGGAVAWRSSNSSSKALRGVGARLPAPGLLASPSRPVVCLPMCRRPCAAAHVPPPMWRPPPVTRPSPARHVLPRHPAVHDRHGEPPAGAHRLGWGGVPPPHALAAAPPPCLCHPTPKPTPATPSTPPARPKTTTAAPNRPQLLETRGRVADAPAAPALALRGGEVVFDGVCFGYEPGRTVLKEARPGRGGEGCPPALLWFRGGGHRDCLRCLDH